MSEYVLVDGDSWVGLYVDGKLELQDHSLDIEDVLELVGKRPVTAITKKFVDTDWLDQLGYLPSKLSKVKFDVR